MQVVNKFRKHFVLDQRVPNWFPGHMFKGMQEILRILKNIDCVIEIHDARVPFTGRNTRFRKDVTSVRPHLLVLNKMDLTDGFYNEDIVKRIRTQEGIDKIIYTNLKSTSDSTRKIVPTALKMVHESDRFQRSDRSDINLLVIGIPNVGKSTFINRIRTDTIRQKNAVAKVGDRPGVTRSIQEKIKISYDPLIYVYDTPGILQPTFRNKVEDPLKLAACGLLPNNIIGNEIISDFILYWLNKQKEFAYVEILGLTQPTDNIYEILYRIAMNFGFTRNVKMPSSFQLERRPNVSQAADHFNNMFRESKFGKHVLDQDLFVTK